MKDRDGERSAKKRKVDVTELGLGSSGKKKSGTGYDGAPREDVSCNGQVRRFINLTNFFSLRLLGKLKLKPTRPLEISELDTSCRRFGFTYHPYNAKVEVRRRIISSRPPRSPTSEDVSIRSRVLYSGTIPLRICRSVRSSTSNYSNGFRYIRTSFVRYGN